ncbi:DUF916 and DUF3324 domain-containing protein [Candidatus Enterococcus ikei]|uniref:DUF916 and DUF3324 domain-containing protein n=1 Tax=Candidatus Enterococcus ikei TaxID=2815326 RepID=A0ABS3H1Q3_9ENTE|nr:DUF916 and DUF3324 domain-containing protein [Enterococcus sp. DIV0869a]MBO0441104.1 DUF916 and DUF3324 domain-containing protein [Enterococcus sp. DIV0869a]
MKNKLTYIVTTVLISIITLSAWSTTSLAQEAGGATGFVYEIKFPENQQKEAGYFDLKMASGQKQKVQVLLKNPRDKEITVETSLNGAKTNMNGVLEYGPINLKKDASLKYDFVDVVKAPEKVVLPPNSEKTLDIEITMPQASYDGVIVGGIQLKKADDEEQKTQNGANVINKYAYVIAMVLQETDAKVEPELNLNKVSAGQSNARNVVYVDVSNIKANFLDNLSMEAQITSDKSEEVLYETKKSSMRMAPNSNMTFPVSMQGEKMVPGKYRAHVLATSGSKKWEWMEDFEITTEEADKFNREDVGLVQEKGTNWLLIIGAAVGLFVVILVIFFIIRAIRKKREASKKAERRKIKKEQGLSK